MHPETLPAHDLRFTLRVPRSPASVLMASTAPIWLGDDDSTSTLRLTRCDLNTDSKSPTALWRLKTTTKLPLLDAALAAVNESRSTSGTPTRLAPISNTAAVGARRRFGLVTSLSPRGSFQKTQRNEDRRHAIAHEQVGKLCRFVCVPLPPFRRVAPHRKMNQPGLAVTRHQTPPSPSRSRPTALTRSKESRCSRSAMAPAEVIRYGCRRFSAGNASTNPSPSNRSSAPYRVPGPICKPENSLMSKSRAYPCFAPSARLVRIRTEASPARRKTSRSSPRPRPATATSLS